MAYELINLRTDTYEGAEARVKELKRNPKTYRTYTYNVQTARTVECVIFANRIHFISVPTNVKIRFNEPENDKISIDRAMSVKQDFHRIFLEWDATDTEIPLVFIAGFGLELTDISQGDSGVADLLYHNTPLGVDVSVLGAWQMGLYKELLLDYISDIDGILHIYTSYDGVDFYNERVLAVPPGVGDYKTIPIESKYVKIVFEKLTPGMPQALLKISARARL